MSSSTTFGLFPSVLENNNILQRADHRQHYSHDPTAPVSPISHPRDQATSPPFSSNNINYNHNSNNNNVHTPADSLSAFSEQYQPSDFSELDTDPFFGVDLNAEGGTPSFLGDSATHVDHSASLNHVSTPEANTSTNWTNGSSSHTYPISPDLTNPSRQASPRSERRSSQNLPLSVSPQELSKPFSAANGLPSSLFQGYNDPPRIETRLQEPKDAMASNDYLLASPSPRISVSMWGRDEERSHNIDEHFREEHFESRAQTARTRGSLDDGFVQASYQQESAKRDAEDPYSSKTFSGPRGIAPDERGNEQVISTNDADSRRKIGEQNQIVDGWILRSDDSVAPNEIPTRAVPNDFHPGGDGISPEEIPTGDRTENKAVSGQTYFVENGGGAITEEDLELMRQNRLFGDAPRSFGISTGRFAPGTSAAAMARFERLCRDNDSVVSVAATWGTRRRSLPSVADVDGVISGNFLKKLSINRERKPSVLFKELRGLVRKPSNSSTLKRSRSTNGREQPGGRDSPDNVSLDRRDSQQSLAPPSRTQSWTRKQQMPSLNTALVSMATGAAAIGTTHARSGSISTVQPSGLTSPRSPFTLQVMRRSRSRSDVSAKSTDESLPNLAGMWKKAGGPPVAQLANTRDVAPDLAEDDDEEDDSFDDGGQDATSRSNFIDEIVPNYAGFQQQVLKANPRLAEVNKHLVDRIAHQQVQRYKALLNLRVRHLQNVAQHRCACKSLCIEQGGAAKILAVKDECRGLDPLAGQYDGSDGDVNPTEGTVNAESFPPDIPQPPTTCLPAEFECQLCFQPKKCNKPSDWTKHVHEDVSPFTCTWDKCRDPKMFKRKADWVRHENEGHRHLEWWTCDVDDCSHTCYRRDNFLQHLIREHKYVEPQIKTKAAIKRAGVQDPIWQKVEICHKETPVKPADEPCKFCGKQFPSWKRLTAHLAKHMENLSLPVLRLVAIKELAPDTIISPIQEPSARSVSPLAPLITDTASFSSQQVPLQQQQPLSAASMGFTPTQQDPYSSLQQSAQYPQNALFGNTSYLGLSNNMDTLALGLQTGDLDTNYSHHAHGANANYSTLPVTSNGFVPANAQQQYMGIRTQTEPFPAMDMSAMVLQDDLSAYNGLVSAANGVVQQQQQQHRQQQRQQQQQHQAQHYTPQGSVSPYSSSPQPNQGYYQS